MKMLALFALSLLAAGTREDELLRAVRGGDLAAVKALLDQGVPVDAKFRYDRTPLSFAADRGHVEIVKLLLARGADVNAKDTFYGMTPTAAAASKGHVEIVKLMLAKDARAASDVLFSGVASKKLPLVEAALEVAKPTADDLTLALESAEKDGAADIAARLRAAGAVPLPKEGFAVDAATLAGYAGRYRQDGGGNEITMVVTDGALHVTGAAGRAFKWGAIGPHRFKHPEQMMTLELEMDGAKATGAKVKGLGFAQHYTRVQEEVKP